MRILQISSVRTLGGGERHVIDLARGLHERGHEVYFAIRPSCEWQDRLDFLPAERIIHASIRNSFGVFSAKRIAKFIRGKNIDVVHAHAARDYIPASLVCRLTKESQFVLTRHVLFPLKPIHRFTLNNLSRAIAVSPAVATNLGKVFPAPKIEIIPNGIAPIEQTDAERAERRTAFRELHSIPGNAQVVGTIGELKELKGQRDFILAAGELARVNPDAFFVIVGKDNSPGSAFRRELKRLIKVYGLENRFLWLDWIDDMPSLLAAMDVFVSASHSESFGLAILEAMISRTPVVATETEGAKGLLRHEESALLVPIREPIALADAIALMLTDAERRNRFTETARKNAVEKFSLKDMLDRTEDLYRRVSASTVAGVAG